MLRKTVGGNPTIASAVLDRLIHGAHRIEPKGEGMRKLRADEARLDVAAQYGKSARSRHAPPNG
jgi:hypothetical protein